MSNDMPNHSHFTPTPTPFDDHTKVKLDVGGVHFSTTTTTLTSESNSMLAAMFSGRYPLQRDKHGHIFIDRDGNSFHHILNWLRNKKVPSLSSAELDSLMMEAEYFQLKELIAALITRKKELMTPIEVPPKRDVLNSETRVLTIVNGWSSYPGISIDTAQQRIQQAIDSQEKDGWTFINSSVETCKAREEQSTGVSTNVNLVHLFFKNNNLPKT